RTAVPALYEAVVPFHVRSPNKLYYNTQHNKINDINIPSNSNVIRHNSESPSTPKRKINKPKYLNSNSSPSHNSKYFQKLNFDSPNSIHLPTPIKTTEFTIGSNDNTPVITPKTQLWLNSTLDMPESSNILNDKVKLLSKTIEKQAIDIKKMKKKMEYKQKLIMYKNTTITKLRKNLKNSRILFKTKNVLNSLNFPSIDSKTLVKMQIRHRICKKPWTNQEQNFSLRLYYKSPSAYKYLRSLQISLPGLTTIKRWIGASKFKPGFNSGLFKQIKMKVDSMTHEETFCTLIFDEMKIKRFLEYSKVLDAVEGYEDLGTFGRSSAMASQAMVFMIRGIYSPWKLPISYFLSSTSMKATTLSELILEQINLLISCKLHVTAIICDQGPNNRSALTKLGFTKENPYIQVNGNKIFAMYDVPHLIKNVRNNLLTSDIIFKNNRVSFQDIKKTYNIDKHSPTSRTLLKITDCHINPGPFKKMSCKLALQVFSKSMYAAMRTCINTNELKSSTATHTADFVKEINNLFDCLNSQKLYSSNPYKCAISEERPQVQLVLEEAKQWCKDLKKCKGHSRPYTFDGLEWTINAILGIYKEQKIMGFNYLLTARFNQDAIENTFSVFRQKGGYNNNPTARTFRIAFKLMTKMQLMKPSTVSNCEADNDNNVLAFNSNINLWENNDDCDDHNDEDNSSILSLFSPLNDDNYIEVPLVNLSMCSDRYFSGYLGKKCIEKFNCMKCHDYMLTSTSVYGSKSGNFSLKIPTENFTDYVSKCQKILSKIVLMKPYQLKIGLTIKNYIIQNIWPNTELHLE
ncbi:Transposable element P transposase, partial [Aphis craccivora]